MNDVVAPAFATRHVGEIATSLPGATAVFRAHKLDFCCGGNVPLAEAAAARGRDLAAIEAALAAIDPGAPRQPASDPAALIETIISRYHAVHRRELPELVRLARRVEAVHARNPAVPNGLAERLEALETELRAHMAKEEAILFPMMLADPGATGGAMAAGPIARMRAEHDDHGAALEAIGACTQGLPAEACTTWRALDAGLRKFSDDLMEHVHLENNVLFPMFERD